MKTNYVLKPIKATKELPKGRMIGNHMLSKNVLCFIDDKYLTGNYSYANGLWVILGTDKTLYESTDVIWFKKIAN